MGLRNLESQQWRNRHIVEQRQIERLGKKCLHSQLWQAISNDISRVIATTNNLLKVKQLW